MNPSKSTVRRIIPFLLVFLIITPGCHKKRTPNEQLLMERLRPCWPALEEYKTENMCYPENWDQLMRWKGMTMAENPFNGQPIKALDSDKFDPATSPGNIYYVKTIKDNCVINCQVIIFGEKGELTRYTHAGPLAPK